MNLTQKLTSGIATGGMLMSVFSPVVLAETSVSVSGNGFGSDNSVQIEHRYTNRINQNNEANVHNEVNVRSNTGENSSWGSRSSNIHTGNASTHTSIANNLNYNVAHVSGYANMHERVNQYEDDKSWKNNDHINMNDHKNRSYDINSSYHDVWSQKYDKNYDYDHWKKNTMHTSRWDKDTTHQKDWKHRSIKDNDYRSDAYDYKKDYNHYDFSKKDHDKSYDDHHDQKDDEKHEENHLGTVMNGHEEVPHTGDLDGMGKAVITIDHDKKQLCSYLSVHHIAPATAAHIHKAPKGAAGPIVIPLPNPHDGNSYGCMDIQDENILRDISENPHDYYVNVHNDEYPEGAIRGQL